jgi:hypothetical protein
LGKIDLPVSAILGGFTGIFAAFIEPCRKSSTTSYPMITYLPNMPAGIRLSPPAILPANQKLGTSRLKKHIALLSIGCLALIGLLTGCDQKPAPFKEGRISELRWTAPDGGDSTYTLRRVDKADGGSRFRAGVETYGVLHPTFLEVRFGQDRDSHVQIIPMSQIVWLEFGDGGRAIDKK